ncbi:hypothetical protein BZL29_5985 [Mycobacterium kansasii]|uniref:Uncharacterized protein n=1 Tax=Mycobacterium kansasii TaxID=1768 RepID=A0A1V3WRX1_MYCKA|nr:hypothetical protein BZL29_5985 [Mycobacterium kansasii]
MSRLGASQTSRTRPVGGAKPVRPSLDKSPGSTDGSGDTGVPATGSDACVVTSSVRLI